MSTDRSERVNSRSASSRKSNRSERASSHTNRSSSGQGANEDAGEQTQRPQVAGSQRGHFKKFFMKVGEKIGTVERTEFSPQFNESCKEFDNYKTVIEDVAVKICQVIQQNHKVIPFPLGDMKSVVDAPGQGPYELLSGALSKANEFLGPNLSASLAQLAAEYGAAEREFQQQGRRAIHFIRNFLRVEYDELNEQRRLLCRARQNMDFARYELSKAKTPETIGTRGVLYENAQREYNDQMTKVVGLLDGIQKHKEKHAEEVVNFYNAYRRYHEICLQKGNAISSSLAQAPAV
ncbi:BAR domain-containing protein [Aphelenchoides besseyi]|nr:BAR domain-containing protein [Aphelenchoides besseyi]KAI6201942.1 BAR domain-containing protein [Aphelenchoides besseyi]